MSQPRCKHYAPKEPGCKEYCTNCKRGIGIQCAEHLTLLKEYETSKKFKSIDMLMRSNRGVYLD